MKNLSQWQDFLEQQHPEQIELGLQRTLSVAQTLGFCLPDNSRPIAQTIVTVAGSNGKGSTIAVLEQLLSDAGFRTAAYTSPHILSFNERFRIAQLPAMDEDICAALSTVDEARGDTPLTFFEFATLAALELFAQSDIDVAILEVGLGGRLDSINVVSADIAVITSIALDHQDYLGDSRELIALEKAGILRAEQTFVCADSKPPDTLIEYALNLGPKSFYNGKDFGLSERGSSVTYFDACTGIPLSSLNLHPDAVAAAIKVFSLIQPDFEPKNIPASVAKAQLSGRFQRINHAGVEIRLDVAHNPASIRYLQHNIVAMPCKGKTLAVFAVMSDKDWPTMLQIISDVIDGWFLAKLPSNDRAEAPTVVAAKLAAMGQQNVSCFESGLAAVEAAIKEAGSEGRVLVFGSFYTVAAVLLALHDLGSEFNG